MGVVNCFQIVSLTLEPQPMMAEKPVDIGNKVVFTKEKVKFKSLSLFRDRDFSFPAIKTTQVAVELLVARKDCARKIFPWTQIAYP